jgi:hypothetical protein
MIVSKKKRDQAAYSNDRQAFWSTFFDRPFLIDLFWSTYFDRPFGDDFCRLSM